MIFSSSIWSSVSFVPGNDTNLTFRSSLRMQRSTYAHVSVPAQQSDTMLCCRCTADTNRVEHDWIGRKFSDHLNGLPEDLWATWTKILYAYVPCEYKSTVFIIHITWCGCGVHCFSFPGPKGCVISDLPKAKPWLDTFFWVCWTFLRVYKTCICLNHQIFSKTSLGCQGNQSEMYACELHALPFATHTDTRTGKHPPQ